MLRHGGVEVLRYGSKYDVAFARYDWGGVLAPCTVSSRDALARFLLTKIGIRQQEIESLLAEVDAHGSAHVEDVVLSDELRLRYGMVAPTEEIVASE